MANEIKKSESVGQVVTRPLGREKGQPRIITSSKFIQDIRKKDLVMPTRLCTFDTMANDDAVFNSIDITNLLVLTALTNGEFKPKKGQASKIAADFLNYCIRNMSAGTWMEAVNNACTDLRYGFSFLNIVTEIRNYGKYAGSKVLKKLAPRDQKSVYGWVWDKDLREFRGFVQKPMLRQLREPTIKEFEAGLFIGGITNGFLLPRYPFLSTQQLLHFRQNPTNNNPQGDSPLIHCYDAWMEKKLVERYEIVGVSKDFGGAVVLRVPSELIEKANDPVNYPNEAAEYRQLQEDAAALHAGESSYIVLTSDVDATTQAKLFDFELKGIDGGGKQYNTSDIIDQKRKSIYNCFGTGFLLLGQTGHGSHSLSDNQMSTHDYYVDRNLLYKTDVINNQLAPRLLAINNISLDYDQMPEFVPADPSKPDLDIIGKFIQRSKSVGGLSQAALEKLYADADLPIDGIEELSFTDKGDSRAGESGGSSGTGNTQNGGSSSATNSENASKSVAKNLVLDYEDNNQIVLIDSSTGESVFINKDN
jgi:hypothetical protein